MGYEALYDDLKRLPLSPEHQDMVVKAVAHWEHKTSQVPDLTEFVAKNVRTGSTSVLRVHTTPAIALGVNVIERLLAHGATLYAKGWDSQEFSVDSIRVIPPEERSTPPVVKWKGPFGGI